MTEQAQPENKIISPWWCTNHWALYAHDPRCHERVCNLLTQLLVESPEFRRALNNLKQKFPASQRSNRVARSALIEQWTAINKAPVCCLVGEPIRQKIFAASGVRPR